MKNHELEAWALRVITQVESGQPNEDSRVELKADWLDPKKAARRLAGHANAAHGESILWLIGVHEEKGAVGCAKTELANWYPALVSQFDALAPEMQINLNVPVRELTVVALLFGTDRAPFVVKNPAHGSTDGGPVSLEVPWREGTAVRSANRSQLLGLLSPQQRLPGFDVLAGQLRVAQQAPADPPSLVWLWQLSASLYVIPRTGDRLVIPFHRCEASFEVKGVTDRRLFDNLRLDLPLAGTFRDPHIDSVTMARTSAELIIEGPGRVDLLAHGQTPALGGDLTTATATVTARLQPVDIEHPVTITIPLAPAALDKQDLGKWVWSRPQ